MSASKPVMVGKAAPKAAVKPRVGLPMPRGGVRVKNLTPSEKELLDARGWGNQPVIPDNFEEVSDAVLRQMAQETLPQETEEDLVNELQARVGASFTRLAVPEVRDVRELPPQEQKRFQKIINDMMQMKAAQEAEEAQLQQLPKSVAEAVMAADQNDSPVIVDDRPKKRAAVSASTAAAAVSEAAEPAEAPKPVAGKCARCGFPKEQAEDELEITDDMRLRYLASITLLQPFEHEVSLFGGALSFSFRILTMPEIDAIWQQMLLDTSNGQLTSAAEQFAANLRYRLALQLSSYRADQVNWLFPRYEEWAPDVAEDDSHKGKLRAIWNYLLDLLKMNETLFNIMSQELMSFNAMVIKLEAQSREPNFWKAAVSS